MDTLYTFGDNSTHYKTESVNLLGLMNPATKLDCLGLQRVSTGALTVLMLHEVFARAATKGTATQVAYL